MEWKLRLEYKKTKHYKTATVEYKSRQVIRIRVEGSKDSILLQCDYPAIFFSNGKKAVKWKVIEPKTLPADKDLPRLLVTMFSDLEYLMKRDWEQLYPTELP